MNFFNGFQYRVIASPLHNLDPRVKFLTIAVMLVGALIFDTIIVQLLILVVLIPLVVVGKILKEWLGALRGIFLFAVAIFAINLFFALIQTNYVVTGEMLELSSMFSLRFMVLILAFSIFFLTTSPDDFSLALQKMHIPYDFCFALILALRFVPVLARETNRVCDAQKSRGLELEKGRLIRKIRNYVPIVIPLIANSLRRSFELAETMESRGWGAKKRTSLQILELKKKDYVTSGFSLILLIILVYVRLFFPLPTLL
ncbi:MAG: energy-coupling factor transporter transmembrane component T [Candidatus Bathyarchaeota archaeon]